MARLDFFVHTGGGTAGEVALVAAAAKTVLQIAAPASTRVAVKGVSVSFDGISGAAEPVVVDLCRQSGATTGSSAATISKRDPAEPTVQTTAVKNINSAAETTDEVIQSWEVHPQSGIDMAFTIEDEVIIAGGAKCGIRCTASANVNVMAKLFCEE
jgi:hypothetical protein